MIITTVEELRDRVGKYVMYIDKTTGEIKSLFVIKHGMKSSSFMVYITDPKNQEETFEDNFDILFDTYAEAEEYLKNGATKIEFNTKALIDCVGTYVYRKKRYSETIDELWVMNYKYTNLKAHVLTCQDEQYNIIDLFCDDIDLFKTKELALLYKGGEIKYDGL